MRCDVENAQNGARSSVLLKPATRLLCTPEDIPTNCFTLNLDFASLVLFRTAF